MPSLSALLDALKKGAMDIRASAGESIGKAAVEDAALSSEEALARAAKIARRKVADARAFAASSENPVLRELAGTERGEIPAPGPEVPSPNVAPDAMEEAFGVIPPRETMGEWAMRRAKAQRGVEELRGLSGKSAEYASQDLLAKLRGQGRKGRLPLGDTMQEIPGYVPPSSRVPTEPELVLTQPKLGELYAIQSARELVGLPVKTPLTTDDAMTMLRHVDRGRQAANEIMGASDFYQAREIAALRYSDLLDAPVLADPLGKETVSLADAVVRQPDAFNARLLHKALADKAVDDISAGIRLHPPVVGAPMDEGLSNLVKDASRHRALQLEYDGKIQLMSETLSRRTMKVGAVAPGQIEFTAMSRAAFTLAAEPDNVAAKNAFRKAASMFVAAPGRDPRTAAPFIRFLDDAVRSGSVKLDDIPGPVLEYWQTAGGLAKGMTGAQFGFDAVFQRNLAMYDAAERSLVKGQQAMAQAATDFRSNAWRLANVGFYDVEQMNEFFRDALMISGKVERDALAVGSAMAEEVGRFHSMPIPNDRKAMEALPGEIRDLLVVETAPGEYAWRGRLSAANAIKLKKLIESPESFTPEEVKKFAKQIGPALGKSAEEASPMILNPKLLETAGVEVVDGSGNLYRYEVKDMIRSLAERLGYEVEIVRAPQLEVAYNAHYAQLRKVASAADEGKALEEMLADIRKGVNYGSKEAKFEAGRFTLVHEQPSARLGEKLAAVHESADRLGEVVILRGPKGQVQPFYDFRAVMAYLNRQALPGGARAGKLPTSSFLSGIPQIADAKLSAEIMNMRFGSEIAERVLAEAGPGVAGTESAWKILNPTDLAYQLDMARAYMQRFKKNTLSELFADPDFDALTRGQPLPGMDRQAAGMAVVAAPKVLNMKESMQALLNKMEFEEFKNLSGNFPSLDFPKKLLGNVDSQAAWLSDFKSRELFDEFGSLADSARVAGTGGAAAGYVSFTDMMKEVAASIERTGGC